MMQAEMKAPAKVNLGLWVLGRRADGYHELWTLMETISLADELTLTATQSGDINLTVSGLRAPRGEGNLVVRAARLLKERCGGEAGADVHLRKVIPMGAGLGGGSSDAAAALVGLNGLWELGLSETDLLALGAEVGSDVPFFAATQLAGGHGAAVCSGRGEQVELLEATGERWYVLALPREGVSTASVYAALGASSDLTTALEDVKKLKERLRGGHIDVLRRWCHNDLQGTALRVSPACRRAYEAMRAEGLPQAMVSGSGSALFCICESEEEAQEYATRLRQRHRVVGFDVVVARKGPGAR